MTPRMSRRLTLLKRRFSGSRDAGLRIGSADAARARSRSCSMAGTGRDGLDALADRAIELGDFRRRRAVARVVLAGQPVLAERRLELILLLELVRPLEMGARRRLHRALQRDLVVRIVGRRLHGPAVRGDRFVEIARAHRRFALAERLARRAPAGAASASASSNRRCALCIMSCHRTSAAAAIESASRNRQSAICNLQSHDPVSRIVCRPRPSRYAISIDSTPIFRMRYRPSMISPSSPWNGGFRPSLEHRDLPPARRRLDDADELERDRRQRRRSRRRRRRRFTGIAAAPAAAGRRRRRRRRLRLEPEQIAFARPGLRPLGIQRLEVDVGRLHALGAVRARRARPAPLAPPLRSSPRPLLHFD